MKRRVTGLVVASVLLSGLGACSGGDPEPSSAPVPRVSATPTPTPTPTQTEPVDEIGVVVDLSDPKIGFELVDVPTDLEGDEADVYTTLALYSREYWRGMTMNEASPLLRTFTDSSLVANLERIAASNAADKADIGGRFQVEVSNIVVEGDRATARLCDDYDDATFADKDGTYRPAEIGFSPPVRKAMELRRGTAPGTWMIVSSERDREC